MSIFVFPLAAISCLDHYNKKYVMSCMCVLTWSSCKYKLNSTSQKLHNARVDRIRHEASLFLPYTPAALPGVWLPLIYDSAV